jgi:hypothetical protein
VSNRTSNPDLDYTSANQPVVAYGRDGRVQVAGFDGDAWNSEEVTVNTSPLYASQLSMGVDSLDRIGLATSNGSGVQFSMKDPASGAWATYQAPQGYYDVLQGLSGVQNISLAFGPNDQTAMLISQYDRLTYAWFDVRTGAWAAETAVTGMASRFSELVFDNTGVPAFAFLGQSYGNPNVYYSRRVGFGWQHVTLPAQANPNGGVSLAFDYENLPVIAFQSYSGWYGGTPGLTLAYDPIEVPEPASLGLLALAALFLRRRGN